MRIPVDYCLSTKIQAYTYTHTSESARTRAYISTYSKLAVHETVHRDRIMKVTNQLQLYRLIYFFFFFLYVSGDVFAHHQKH
jgi:hypothetical protein